MSRSQPYRAPSGGAVDRSRPLGFVFDGSRYTGYAGDTLASALIANGLSTVARSFKYHRPRGVFALGAEEPNALVQLGEGAATEANARATQVELHDGLVAASQNCWPSVEMDIGEVNSLVSALLPSGFYYKTFMWPADKWPIYERFIRRAAGMGRTATEPDPDRYEHARAQYDVLVVGGGPAGLAAALAAGRTGARVAIADEGPEFGGSLLHDLTTIDGREGRQWARETEAALAEMPELLLLRRTTVFGYYDHNMLCAVERATGGGAHAPRQRLHWMRARRVVLATGAHERPIVFPGNDRPGIMLASAARGYANRYAVLAGRNIALFVANDGAYATALDLAVRGASVAAIVDARPNPNGVLPTRARTLGMRIFGGSAIVATHGHKRIAGIEVMALAPDGATVEGAARHIDCDALLVSGGWSPAVHLFSQSRGRLRYDDSLAAFAPGESKQDERSVGAARGLSRTADCLADGFAAGAEAAQAAGFGDGVAPKAPRTDEATQMPARYLWAVPKPRYGQKRFVDLQNDVTAEDVALAAREGYRSVEHVKRYTTLGMGTDQGKTSNVAGLAILSELTGRPIAATGTTTFRPPYTPLTFGALVGSETGVHVEPIRETAMHAWHVAHGAHMMNAGLWKRPQFYRRPGESDLDAVTREAGHVRRKVGLVDVSTLGKIDIQGRDAAELLDRVYTNSWKKLPVGKTRYGVMLREDGFVFDDGTTTRLGDRHFMMTTTTANAVKVMQHLELYLQVHWPDLKVHVASVTEQWAAMAVAGPDARKVMAKAAPGLDLSNEALPFMGWREATVCGFPARVFRISFSGELSYEINVGADCGLALWERLIELGREFDLMAYGVESMGVLRIEKGHFVVGPEADGRTTLDDLGLGAMMSPHKDCIGKRSLDRPALRGPGRKQLVGLLTADERAEMPRAAQLVKDPKAPLPNAMEGHVTAYCFSPTLDRWIGLALVENGRARMGQELWAQSPLAGKSVKVRIAPSIFVDPKGERLRV